MNIIEKIKSLLHRGEPAEKPEDNIYHGEPKCQTPKCGGKAFFEGPHGGISTMVKCAKCNCWWVFTPLWANEYMLVPSNGPYTGVSSA